MRRFLRYNNTNMLPLDFGDLADDIFLDPEISRQQFGHFKQFYIMGKNIYNTMTKQFDFQPILCPVCNDTIFDVIVRRAYAELGI